MDTTFGPVAHALLATGRLGARFAILALIGVTLAIVLAGVIGDLLPPASETIIVAPFRW